MDAAKQFSATTKPFQCLNGWSNSRRARERFAETERLRRAPSFRAASTPISATPSRPNSLRDSHGDRSKGYRGSSGCSLHVHARNCSSAPTAASSSTRCRAAAAAGGYPQSYKQQHDRKDLIGKRADSFRYGILSMPASANPDCKQSKENKQEVVQRLAWAPGSENPPPIQWNSRWLCRDPNSKRGCR